MIFARSTDAYFLGEASPHKEQLLEFMHSGDEDAIWEGYITDLKTGEAVEPKTVGVDYVSHGLSWSNEDAYNFEHYDLALSPEFCKAALDVMGIG